MSSILEMLSNQIGADGVRKIGQSIGAGEASTGKAVGAALPLLLGALARNSQSPEGAQALHGAVSRDHDGGILDNVTQFLGSGDGGAGNGILGHVLGNRSQAVEQGVGKASGLDASAVSRLLPMLAPLVMGAVGRSQRQANADPGASPGSSTPSAARSRARCRHSAASRGCWIPMATARSEMTWQISASVFSAVSCADRCRRAANSKKKRTTVGIFKFLKNVGRKDDAESAQQERNMELIKGNKLLRYVMGLGLEVEGLRVTFDDGVATVTGTAATQAVREKVVLAFGEHGRRVAGRRPDRRASRGARGDPLYRRKGRLALQDRKAALWRSDEVPADLRCQQAMLEDPNLIYPGQVLRIPDPATANK